MPLLEVRGVGAGYGQVRALADVSLTLDEGEAVAVIGSNGAGKSTLMNVVAGVKRPTSGSLWWGAHDMTAWPTGRRVRAGLVLVPEGRHVFPRLSVRANLLLGEHALGRQHDDRRRLDEVLAIFPILDERAKQLAGTLSGGEQQMLAIARALMSRPSLLMLDEPSVGLAPGAVAATYEILGRIRESGTTMLLVEQQVHRALEFADRAYLLQTGAVVGEGPCAQLKDSEQVRKAYLGM